MKKTILTIIFVIIAVAVVVLGLRFLSGDEDTWLCQNGQWVKHGNPASPMPLESCPGSQVFTTIKGNNDIIKITKPLSQAIVSSPLEIEGEARGTWYFEASFPIKLLDDKGQEITRGIAQAQSDPATGEVNWMTENFVPFKAEIGFSVAADTDAILVFMKDNPSGLPENADQLIIPIHLLKSDKMTVKVFFNNENLDPEFSCNKVFPVERIITKTQAPARAALELLLKGKLTDKEISDGFGTNINSGVKIQKLTIENSVAYADFDEQLEFQVGGSCRVSAIRSQIIQTLKQFSTVKDVVISINGRTEDILQP